jgi:hypothetical protein
MHLLTSAVQITEQRSCEASFRPQNHCFKIPFFPLFLPPHLHPQHGDHPAREEMQIIQIINLWLLNFRKKHISTGTS